jgi:hypothetical protein
VGPNKVVVDVYRRSALRTVARTRSGPK